MADDQDWMGQRRAAARSSPTSASSMRPASIPTPARCWCRATASAGHAAARALRGARRLRWRRRGGATVIDGMGATLMPGLIDGHLHLSWNNAPGIDPIQMMEVEEHMLVTMEMAKLVIDAGFTAGRGAAAAKPRLDVVVQAIHQPGPLPGAALPRGRARDHHRRRPRRRRALAHPARGAEPRPRRLGPGGDPAHGPHAHQVRRRLDQAEPLGRGDHRHGRRGDADVGGGGGDGRLRGASAAARCCGAHARSSGSVKQCVRHGIQNIYHASFADEEALDMLEAAKDRHFVAPGIAWLINTARHAERVGHQARLARCRWNTSASSRCASTP